MGSSDHSPAAGERTRAVARETAQLGFGRLQQLTSQHPCELQPHRRQAGPPALATARAVAAGIRSSASGPALLEADHTPVAGQVGNPLGLHD
jgi:hypothetical protein